MKVKEIIMTKKFTKSVRKVLVDSYEMHIQLSSRYPTIPFATSFQFFYADLEEVGYSIIDNYTLEGIESVIKEAETDPVFYEVCIVVFAYIKKDKYLNTKTFRKYLQKFLSISNKEIIKCEKIKSCLIYLQTDVKDSSLVINFPSKVD